MDEAQVDFIKAKLFNEVSLYPNVYVLLDMGRSHALEECIRGRAHEDSAYLKHVDFEDQPEKAPLLVKLSDRHDELLDASVELAAQQSTSHECRLRQVGGWLFSSLPPGGLASLLSSKLKLLHSNGKARLRFYDPRVMTQLPFIFDVSQLTQLESGIEQWFFMNEGLQLQSTTFASSVPTSRSAFFVGAEQWSALKRVEVVNSAIHLLRTLGCSYEQGWIPQLHQLIQNAVAHGVTLNTDQAAFAGLGIWLHPNFDRHPRIRQVLDEVRMTEASFCEAMGSLNDQALSQVRYDMEQSSGMTLV